MDQNHGETWPRLLSVEARVSQLEREREWVFDTLKDQREDMQGLKRDNSEIKATQSRIWLKLAAIAGGVVALGMVIGWFLRDFLPGLSP